jgi:sodium-dependent dicarboxylate transporter 2/3/5
MWSSQVMWLMLGGFFLAEGMSRTGLDRKLLALAIRPAGKRPDRVLLAVMLTSATASMFISNTSTTVLLVGAVLPLCRRIGREDPFARGLLVAGGLALGAAVVDTGLAERLASGLRTVTGVGFDPLIYLVLAFVTVALSNFMSNTATVSVMLPVSVALLPGRELETCLILGLSASCALLLPVSTPPNAVAFSTGELTARDFRPGGILVGLLGPVVVIAWVLLVSRFVV